MMLSFILYNQESAKRVIERTKSYFDGTACAKVGNNIWLKNMYISFEPPSKRKLLFWKKNVCRTITVNIFDEDSDWKDELINYVYSAFDNEKVYISNSANTSKYYDSFTRASNIEPLLIV